MTPARPTPDIDHEPILAGLRIVEYPAYIAAPLGGLVLAQLGAEVIRVDPPGGNIDHGRWPLTAQGDSLYWASLNRGKRSVELDLRSHQSRRVLCEMLRNSGDDGRIFVTNLAVDGELSYESLSAGVPGLIMVRLSGNHDGSPALDYTVNAGLGFPLVTGEPGSGPVNHVLPAWDIAAGLFIALAILAAERRRRTTGTGQLITVALSDVAMSIASDLGFLAEAQCIDRARQADGNYLYGAYGDSFATADGRHAMVVAISNRQWRELIQGVGLEAALTTAADALGYSLDDEGGRFEARELISAFLRPWFARRSINEIRKALSGRSVLWSPYRSFKQMLAEDPRCSIANPMFAVVDNPKWGSWMTAGSPLAFSNAQRQSAGVAPTLGMDTQSVLDDLAPSTPSPGMTAAQPGHVKGLS